MALSKGGFEPQLGKVGTVPSRIGPKWIIDIPIIPCACTPMGLDLLIVNYSGKISLEMENRCLSQRGMLMLRTTVPAHKQLFAATRRQNRAWNRVQTS